MTGILLELRATALDKDNCPRMDSECWLPVGLALRAADEIERLRSEYPYSEIDLDMAVAAERERCNEIWAKALDQSVAEERERCEAERWKVDDSGIEISQEELCALSREFNKHANLSDPHHYRINEWLKRQIAAIRKGE